MKPAVILLVEDKVDMLLINQQYLKKLGYKVLCAETLAEARVILERTPPSVIVLDIMLPDGSGLDFLSIIRTYTRAPVIFLSCLNEDSDIIEGLQRGGDDYMVKPYNLEELAARIEAHLRRAQDAQREWTFGPLTLDVFSQRVYVNGRDAVLQPKEYALLYFLVKNRGIAFTSNELLDAVWGNSSGTDVGTIKSRIYHIRKKLDMDDDSTWLIESIGKSRYRFTGR